MTPDGYYESRREQIEAEDVPACLKAKTPRTMKRVLRTVAFVAACGERDRTLEILRRHGVSRKVIDEICEMPVTKVLGYE